MRAYINGLSAVSPQKTFSGKVLTDDPVNYSVTGRLRCIEPPVREFIDPMISRRMSRIIRLGICSALQCLRNAGAGIPDGIITGTGLGCIDDTEKFLRTMYINEEKLLNPTPFIQSTHNTLSSAIAINLKCNNYNSTYVHRGSSFENALTDAVMLMHEHSAENILLGGADELTDDSFAITDRLGFWKKEPVESLRLLDYKTRGSLAGEGMTFFLLSISKNEKSYAATEIPEMFYKPENIAEIWGRISSFIHRKVGHPGNIDLVLMGLNGDIHSDEIYHSLKEKIFQGVPCAYYKHLCGEYDTSSAFAMFMAAEIIRNQYVPRYMSLDNYRPEKIKNVLIYNHQRNVIHSMILLSSC
jgi:3-oxoacyl-(acyl-carrier-protein) synthase